MRDVIEKIVKTEQDADKIILAAREKAAALLAEADAEISRNLQELKQTERERISQEQSALEAREAEKIQQALDDAKRRYAVDEDEAQVTALGQQVAERIKQTVFEE